MTPDMRRRLNLFLLIFFGIMVLGTVGFMAVEKKSVVDAAYFVIVTMATVGYGDIHPLTDGGKIFTILLIVLGVGAFLGVIANITDIILARREGERRVQKLNMVIGVFFSEVGIGLLERLNTYDPDFDRLRHDLVVSGLWTDKDFQKARKNARKHDYAVDMTKVDLHDLKRLLLSERECLVRLLENPILLEHEAFTDLLRAVFHVTEELSYRPDFSDLPKSDRDHLANDIKQAYHLIVDEWLVYMKYLKGNYHFLFSLAVRTNPFDKTASVFVSGS